MRRCLDEFVIEGVTTNIEFMEEILANEKIYEGRF